MHQIVKFYLVLSPAASPPLFQALGDVYQVHRANVQAKYPEQHHEVHQQRE